MQIRSISLKESTHAITIDEQMRIPRAVQSMEKIFNFSIDLGIACADCRLLAAFSYSTRLKWKLYLCMAANTQSTSRRTSKCHAMHITLCVVSKVQMHVCVDKLTLQHVERTTSSSIERSRVLDECSRWA